MDLLIEQIPSRREDVRFAKVGREVRAMLDREDAVWMTQDERTAIGRQAVLEAVSDVCDRAPELKLDWYAVSATA